MPGGVELATAYLTLIPSLKGAGRSIEDQLSGIDTTDAGKSIGSKLGKSVGSGLDLDPLSKRLAGAGKSIERLGKSFADVGDGITSHVTVPLAGAAVGVGAFALSTATAAETSEMAFTTMLGSADKAREMMGELADFAAHTPFELSGLTTATQQLMAYGFEAEEVIPMLTAVGDATAALGTGQAGIESVTRALGQMQTRGKVSAEEMLQLTEAGIPAWEYLAEAIGTDTAGAMEAVSSGAVDAQTGIDALTAGMERDFGGMMESQSKTVAGLMSNLSDAIQQPLMELRDSRAYEAFASALGKVVDAAGPFVESLLPHMENALSTVSDVLGVAADAMDSFSNMSYSSQKQLLTLVTAAAAAGPAMSVLGRGVQGVGTILTGVGKASETFSKLLGKIPTSANKAAAATTAVTDAAAGAATAASGLGASLSVLGTSVAVAGAAYVLGSVASVAMEAYENAETLKTATMDLGSALTNVQPNAEALAGGIGNMNYSAELAAEQLASLNQETLDAFGEVATQSAQLDSYTSTIQALANQSSLTASEQQRLKAAVEGYNEITGDSVEITNAATGELSKNTDEIIRNAEAYKQRAKAQAAEESLTEYYAQQIDLEQQIAAAQEDVNQKQATYNQQLDDLKSKYGNHWREHTDQVMKAKGDYEKANDALESLNAQYDSVNENIDTMSGIAAASAAQLSGPLYEALQAIPPEMQTVGTDVANALQAGIDSGSINAETAAAMLSSGIVEQVNRLPSSMQAAGATAVANLATAVQNGSITNQQAAQILTAAINGEVSTLPPELQSYGQQAANDLGVSLENGAPTVLSASQTLANSASSKISQLPGVASILGKTGGSNFAGGISSQQGNVRSAASSLSSAASGMGKGDSWTWGSHMAGNFASGLRSGVGKVASAASAIASQAAAYLKHSTPKLGPLADDDVWGLHLGENLADGMVASVPDVERASLALADAASLTGDASYRRAAPMSVARRDEAPRIVQNFSTRVVRADEDLYAVAPIIYRNATREARLMAT